MIIASILATAYGAALAISAVSGNGVTPIRITTPTPHGYGNGEWVAINGVLGNTAANVNDQVTVIDPNNFSVPGTGNGAWTGGGTVAMYYGIANGLIMAGASPLSGAQVYLGPEHLAENNDCPRIVVVPTDIPITGRAAFNSENLLANGPNGAINTYQPIGGGELNFEVHCWGADYDGAWCLAKQFFRSMVWTLTSGNFKAGRAKWPVTTIVDVRGRELVLPVSWIDTISALPVAVTLAGAGTHGVFNDYIDNAGNATGTTPVTG